MKKLRSDAFSNLPPSLWSPSPNSAEAPSRPAELGLESGPSGSDPRVCPRLFLLWGSTNHKVIMEHHDSQVGIIQPERKNRDAIRLVLVFPDLQHMYAASTASPSTVSRGSESESSSVVPDYL